MSTAAGLPGGKKRDYFDFKNGRYVFKPDIQE